jgi:hypothetical protein
MHGRLRSILLRRVLACHVQRGSDRRDIPIVVRPGRNRIAGTERVRLHQSMR